VSIDFTILYHRSKPAEGDPINYSLLHCKQELLPKNASSFINLHLHFLNFDDIRRVNDHSGEQIDLFIIIHIGVYRMAIF